MLGQKRLTLHSAAGFTALAFAAAACDPGSANTGPTGTQSKDFATGLRAVAGDQQAGPLGATLPQLIQVKVVDAGGQPVQGATVTFSVRAGGGSVNPAANISDAGGLVSVAWTMGGTLGPAKIVALLTNSFLVDSAVFTATATTGAAAVFTKVSGDNQTGLAGGNLAAPLVVKVKDAYGNNISGAKVTWTPNGGTVSFTSDTTAADGTASATWRLGTVAPSAYAANASVAGVATPLTFGATATADTSRVLTLVSGDAQTAGISSPLPVAIRVRVTDRFLNAVSGEAISWANSLTGGGTFSPTTSVTNASGEATTTWTLGSHPGLQSDTVRSATGGKVGLTATATLQFWDVKAGNFQTCGIATINDRVYCWGLNDVGQLGKGLNVNISVPSSPVGTTADSVNGPFPSFRQVTAGESLFCGLTPARALYCWGRLITGATTNVATLQAIASGGSQATANLITVGEEHACHLSLPGEGFCTGVNESGQVGNGTIVSTAANFWSRITAPPALFSTLTAGRSHTCGMPRYDGTVGSQQPWCWGLNNAGQLGDGTTVNRSVATAVVPPAAGTVFDSLSLTAGGAHTCAIVVGGTAAYCWGNNGFGQLGIGAPDDGPHPTVGAAVLTPAGASWATLVAGEYHTCGITTTGDAYCWGRNDYGQVGAAVRTPNAPTPVPVVGSRKFRSISVGELHTCAVEATLGTPVGPSSSPGTVYCWGDNVFGQIGIGSSGNNAPVLIPTRVSFQP